MRFDKSKDPGACAAKDTTRYAIHGVAIVEKGDATFLVSTDGRSLSMIRAYPEDGDDMPAILGQGRIYPPAAFAAARKACKRKPDASLTLNGAAWVQADGASTEFARVDGTFPDALEVIPKSKAKQTLRLNAEYLARLQKALGANGVEIQIHELEQSGAVDAAFPLTIRPIYTNGGTDDGSFGVIMPIRGD